MKHLLLGVGLFLCTYTTYAQTPELNQEKYWKFRNNYKEKFMKIGPGVGEGLPARALVPFGCLDNTTDPGNTAWNKGIMKWGDGMIRHGHYLTLLASEYRLLMNNGQTQQAQATLNELYYALYAVFRLDINAEENQDQIHLTNIAATENLNGFFNREDVGEDFAKNNWKDDPMSMGCTYGAYYTNNNTAKIDNGADLVTKGNSYQNTPSMDQTSGLLVGLAMVVKLVDNVTVQPSSGDLPRDVRLWAQETIFWIVDNIARNNWFMIDVTGWPVNNGGGDAALFAIPLKSTSVRFGYTNNPIIPSTATRRLMLYDGAQAAATGYGLEGPWDGSPIGVFQESVLMDITQGYNNCSDYFFHRDSPFLQWQNCGVPINVLEYNPVLNAFWYNRIPNEIPAMYADFEDDGTFNETHIGQLWQIFRINKNPFKSNNNNILFNMGVLMGGWSAQAVEDWADFTGNRELDLINSIINNQTPLRPASYYKAFLDQMNFNGPYNMIAAHYDASTGNYTDEMEAYHGNGWAGEYRWTSLDESVNIEGEKGIYSALDYMVMYNLYHLKFGNSLPAYKEGWSCTCADQVSVPVVGSTIQQEVATDLNSQLAFVENCQESVFYPVTNIVGSVFNIEPKFAEYPSWGIYTTKYQTENATVLPGGIINVKTRFVVCNGTLNIQSGGRLNTINKEMIVNTNGVVQVNGILAVGDGTTLTLKSGSKLQIANGGILKVEATGKLIIEEGATLEYYDGGELMLDGANSELELGGTIRAMNATLFTVTSASQTVNKGKFTITSPNAAFLADAQSYFRLDGYSVNDPFLKINPGARLHIADPDIVNFRISDCSVELMENASILAEDPVLAYHVKFFSTKNNGGFTLTDGNSFVDCRFTQVPVKAAMNIENNAGFSATDCIFEAPSAALNPSDKALLKIKGMGLNVARSSFTANSLYCIESSALTRSSMVADCNFAQYDPVSGSAMTCISDFSDVEYKISGSSFQKAKYGIGKSYGKLSLKCNSFLNNDYCNIKILNGCALNMSISDLAGYNFLYKSLQNRSIEITSCPINLKDGYNFIEECSKTISGTTSLSCTPPGCSVDLTNNQWNTANSIPSNTSFQIQTASNNYIVLPITNPVAAQPACGYYDGTIVIGPPKTKSTIDTDGMPVFWSEIEQDSIRLDDAIVAAMQKMTSYDSLGNDLDALERYGEIYNSDVDAADSLTRNYLWFAFDHMKSTLEQAFTQNQITYTANESNFEEHVALFVDALRMMTDSVITSENYLTQFYHEIDKAHLFRVIGQTQIGLNILNELEYCGIDSTEQAELNHWKNVFSEDLVVEQIGNAALDSVIEIDTTGYILPDLQVNQFSFGAIINDLNNISYPNCDYYNTREKDILASQSLQLYPNPANSDVMISLSRDVAKGMGELVIYQTDGRKVFTGNIDTNDTMLFSIKVSNWNKGVYSVKFIDSKGIVYHKQLVVQ
jgi:hypothetical protein